MAESNHILLRATRDAMIAARDALLGTLTTRSGEGGSQPAAIAINASLSDAVDLGAMRLQRINMPAAWDAAGLTFQASVDGAAFLDLHDKGGEVSVPAAAGRSIVVDQAAFRGVRYLRVRSGTAAAPVAQLAARALTLVTVPR